MPLRTTATQRRSARGRDRVRLTVDAVWIVRGRVLLVRRGRPPFRGRWALPGGFVEPRETVQRAVERELFEETGLKGTAVSLLGVYSEPGRDPRGSTVTLAFRIRGAAAPPHGGSDAREAAWRPVQRPGALAFDHRAILREALWSRGRPRRPRAGRRENAGGPPRGRRGVR